MRFRICVLAFITIWDITNIKSKASQEIINDLNITAFNMEGNIHLNVTWTNPLKNVHFIATSPICSFLDEKTDIESKTNLARNSLIIRPYEDWMVVRHNCPYNFNFWIGSNKNISQEYNYTVPNCVEDNCECAGKTNSPFVITKLVRVGKSLFKVFWETQDRTITLTNVKYSISSSPDDNCQGLYNINNLNLTNSSSLVNLGEIKANDIICGRFLTKYFCIFCNCIEVSDAMNTPFLSSSRFIATKICIIVVLSIVLLFILIKHKRRKRKFLVTKRKETLCRIKSDQSLNLPIDKTNGKIEFNTSYVLMDGDHYEVPRHQIHLKQKLDGGEFGNVHLAKSFNLNNIPGCTLVAVKLLREGASVDEIEEFKAEIQLMKEIGHHENIVKLLGCCTLEKPYYMIMELVPAGSLRKYLHSLRDKWSVIKKPEIFFPDELESSSLFQDYKLQLSNNQGLDPELASNCSSKSCTSYIPMKDLSKFTRCGISEQQKFKYKSSSRSPITPNFKISSILEDTFSSEHELQTPLLEELSISPKAVLNHRELHEFALQISSGMEYLESIPITHRDLAARNILMTPSKTLKICDFGMSRAGPYVNNKTKKQPLRWMAIEAIEKQRCDSKTDVWSFGIVLWEIGTLGGFPYESIGDAILLHELRRGTRLDRPEICTDELYKIMLECWDENPAMRPSFKDLKARLSHKRETYIDFKRLNPTYTFPPIQNI